MISPFRPFTKSDWASYSGAIDLPDGRAPLLTETRDATWIVTGVPDSKEVDLACYLVDNFYFIRLPTAALAEILGATLAQHNSTPDLAALGFRN